MWGFERRRERKGKARKGVTVFSWKVEFRRGPRTLQLVAGNEAYRMHDSARQRTTLLYSIRINKSWNPMGRRSRATIVASFATLEKVKRKKKKEKFLIENNRGSY